MKIKTFLATTAVVAIVGVNAYYATSDSLSTSDLNVTNVENVAEGEDPQLNKWYMWFTQGLTKDEKSMYYLCHNVNGHSGYNQENEVEFEWVNETGTKVLRVKHKDSSGSGYDFYTEGKLGVECEYGTTNCTRVKCN